MNDVLWMTVSNYKSFTLLVCFNCLASLNELVPPNCSQSRLVPPYRVRLRTQGNWGKTFVDIASIRFENAAASRVWLAVNTGVIQIRVEWHTSGATLESIFLYRAKRGHRDSNCQPTNTLVLTLWISQLEEKKIKFKQSFDMWSHFDV